MNIAEQIKWERECVARGTERYYANQDRLRDTGQSDQTDVGSYLLKKRLQEVADRLKSMAYDNTAGRGNTAGCDSRARYCSAHTKVGTPFEERRK